MHVCTHCTCTCFNACTYLFQVPNAGHKAVADLEKRLTSQGRNVTVVTQNIDRLHHKAGSQNVIEMHGMSVYRQQKLCCRSIFIVACVLLLTWLGLFV